MPPKRISRPRLERLESRLALSNVPIAGIHTPDNTLDVGHANITPPGAVAPIITTVLRQNLANLKHSTVLGLSAQPAPGAALQPRILGTRGPTGQNLPFQVGRPFYPGRSGQAIAFTRLDRPGHLTTLVTGRNQTTGQVTQSTYLPGDINGDGKVDLNDLRAFAPAYLTSVNDGFYNPSADSNRNGFVGQRDAVTLVHNETPLTPKIPLNVYLTLAPGEVAKNTGDHTSGAVTYAHDVTVLGHTTPGSIVFADSGLGNYTFTGPALPTDKDGNFSIQVHLRDQLTNTEYLVFDPFGQQTIRAFPILRIPQPGGS